MTQVPRSLEGDLLLPDDMEIHSWSLNSISVQTQHHLSSSHSPDLRHWWRQWLSQVFLINSLGITGHSARKNSMVKWVGYDWVKKCETGFFPQTSSESLICWCLFWIFKRNDVEFPKPTGLWNSYGTCPRTNDLGNTLKCILPLPYTASWLMRMPQKNTGNMKHAWSAWKETICLREKSFENPKHQENTIHIYVLDPKDWEYSKFQIFEYHDVIQKYKKINVRNAMTTFRSPLSSGNVTKQVFAQETTWHLHGHSKWQ